MQPFALSVALSGESTDGQLCDVPVVKRLYRVSRWIIARLGAGRLHVPSRGAQHHFAYGRNHQLCSSHVGIPAASLLRTYCPKYALPVAEAAFALTAIAPKDVVMACRHEIITTINDYCSFMVHSAGTVRSSGHPSLTEPAYVQEHARSRSALISSSPLWDWSKRQRPGIHFCNFG